MKAWEIGRGEDTPFVTNNHLSFDLYALYGWTNGNTDEHAALRTSALVEAAFCDQRICGGGPAIFA